MVLGIISIPFCMSIVFGIVGLILSIMGAKKTPEGVKNTYAKAGKICSIIGLVLGVLVWCAYILIIILAINSANSTVNSLSTF
jgi:hypothetical protein